MSSLSSTATARSGGSMLPFVLGSVVLHVALIALVPGWTDDHGPHVALASQTRAVRLVLPPLPREPEPRPEPPPEPPPEPVPEPPPVDPPPVAPVFEPPPPIETAPKLPEPPPPEPQAVEVTEPVFEPPPEPTTELEPVPEPPEPVPEPEPEVVPPVEPPPEPPPEDVPPQPGDADVDEAALEVQAVPDPAFAPRPKYPRKARVRKWQGTTWLEVDVDGRGEPTSVRLHESSGHTILDDAAIETVRTWKFTPGQRGGKAAATTVRVPVTFRIVDR